MRRILSVLGHGRWIGIVVLLALGIVRTIDPLPIEGLRNRSFDLYQRVAPRPMSEPLETLIVDIDETSLNELGQWPWPRTLLANMVVNLMNFEAIVVGFDILFTEKDRLSPSEFAKSNNLLDEQTKAKLRILDSNDEIFAKALQQSRAVLAQSAYYGKILIDEQRPPKKIPYAYRGPDPRQFIPNFPSLVRPLPILEKATTGLGLITVQPDSDGVVRRVPMVLTVNNRVYPSLSLEMMRIALGNVNRPFLPISDERGVKEIALTKKFRIPTNRDGTSWVYFAAQNPEKRYISAVDVIMGRVNPDRIKGKFILVGTSAIGLSDIRNTPISPTLPGVELHANVIETILTQSYLKRPLDALGQEILLALITGTLLIMVMSWAGSSFALGLLIAIVAALVGFSWFQFIENKTLLDATYPVLSNFILYSLLSYLDYVKTSRERKHVKTAFSQYLSPALLAQLADDPKRLQLGGEMKEISIMFSDIRGFTAISEQFKDDPQGLTILINQFLTSMTEVIMERRGTIDKYMGDCIMAFWNAPVEDSNHAANTCDSALKMITSLTTVNESMKLSAQNEGRKYFPIHIGIGVNSGEVIVGNMGSTQRFDYSILGDAVNLASRLESQSKNYGVDIVVGEETVNLVTDQYAFLLLDRIAVKGKIEAVRIYALVGDKGLTQDHKFKTLADSHSEMINEYTNQDWVKGEELLKHCQTLDVFGLSVLYNLYQQRFDEYRVNPPPLDWDGVYIATTK